MAEHSAQTLPILMYHSISGDLGPTSIPPAIFKMQMEQVYEQGWTVVSPSDVQDWRVNGKPLPIKALAITFDDGFSDFAESAYPILESLKFPCLIFMPTALAGQAENWAFGNQPGRSLLPWQDIQDLDGDLVRFGAHSRTHADLTKLEPQKLDDEVRGSREELETQIGRTVPEFAPPYGRVNADVLSAIQKSYDISYGVKLALANSESPVFNMPRLEMFYYQDEKTWRNFLSGHGGMHLAIRQTLRGLKSSVTGLLRSQENISK